MYTGNICYCAACNNKYWSVNTHFELISAKHHIVLANPHDLEIRVLGPSETVLRLPVFCFVFSGRCTACRTSCCHASYTRSLSLLRFLALQFMWVSATFIFYFFFIKSSDIRLLWWHFSRRDPLHFDCLDQLSSHIRLDRNESKEWNPPLTACCCQFFTELYT